MKVYVVELWSDIHNCGYEQNDPVVFSTKENANKYARGLFEECYPTYEKDLQELDDFHWLTKPTEEDGGWSFNTDREDRFECEVHEVEVK